MPNVPARSPRRRPVADFLLVVSLLAASACADPAAPDAPRGGPARAALTATIGPIPVYLPAVPHIVAGGAHTCAVRRDWVLLCWGANWDGQLGFQTAGASADVTVPVQVTDTILFNAVAAGANHSCALGRDGRAYCWGAGGSGQLGNGLTATVMRPVEVFSGLRFLSITAGEDHSCGITTDHTAFCWGGNARGQLGIGSTDGEPHRWPEPVMWGWGLTFSTISAGRGFTCAIQSSGRAMCWGAGAMLGAGANIYDRPTPDYVAGGDQLVSLRSGPTHSCAVRKSDGAGLCWGGNMFGESSANVNAVGGTLYAPTRVGGATDFFKEIGVGDGYSCGVRKVIVPADTARNVVCWGRGGDGQLGYGGTESGATMRVVSTQYVAGAGFRSIGVGERHSCGISNTGAAYCWGSGGDGQIGYGGSLSKVLSPRAVAGGNDFSR